MTTDTPDRDKLSGFPCPYYITTGHVACNPDQPNCAKCAQLPIYRAHNALRDDMRKLRAAVLGDMTAEEAAKMYREAQSSCDYWGGTDAGDHMTNLADAVAKL